jgi:hypothetical protein
VRGCRGCIASVMARGGQCSEARRASEGVNGARRAERSDRLPTVGEGRVEVEVAVKVAVKVLGCGFCDSNGQWQRRW